MEKKDMRDFFLHQIILGAWLVGWLTPPETYFISRSVFFLVKKIAPITKRGHACLTSPSEDSLHLSCTDLFW